MLSLTCWLISWWLDEWTELKSCCMKVHVETNGCWQGQCDGGYGNKWISLSVMEKGEQEYTVQKSMGKLIGPKQRKNGCFLLSILQNTSRRRHPLIRKSYLFLTHLDSKPNWPQKSRRFNLIITSMTPADLTNFPNQEQGCLFWHQPWTSLEFTSWRCHSWSSSRKAWEVSETHVDKEIIQCLSESY